MDRPLCIAATSTLTTLLIVGCDHTHERHVANGVVYRNVLHNGQRFHVVTVDPHRALIDLIWKKPDGTLVGTLADAKTAGGDRVVFATNAGIFAPDRTPLGVLIQDGRELVPLNSADGTGNFFLKPNGTFSLGPDGAVIRAADGFVPTRPTLAVQSGPMLLINGIPHPAFATASPNKTVRSGVGVNASGDVVFVLSDGPVTFLDLSLLYRDALGCHDALYLDGGISKMFVSDVMPADATTPFSAMFIVRATPQ